MVTTLTPARARADPEEPMHCSARHVDDIGLLQVRHGATLARLTLPACVVRRKNVGASAAGTSRWKMGRLRTGDHARVPSSLATCHGSRDGVTGSLAMDAAIVSSVKTCAAGSAGVKPAVESPGSKQGQWLGAG